LAVRVADRPGWTRRAVLAAGAGVAVAGPVTGCTWWRPDPQPPPPPDPLEPLLAGTRALAGRYDRTLAAHPELAGRLRPLHQAHLAHEGALLATIGRPELASPSPPPATGTWSPPLAGRGIATDPVDAIGELREAERNGRREAAQACLAGPPERAALLGSITAARASHAEALAGYAETLADPAEALDD
jgi:hypothetical protein